MNILILSAFPEEQAHYLSTLEIVSASKIRSINVTECRTATNRIYLACTGMGTINAAGVLGYLVAKLEPDAIFFSGTAGAVDPTLRKGDVIIALEAVDSDILAVHDGVKGTPFEGALINPNTREKTPLSYLGNQALIEHAERLRSLTPRFFSGKVATSNHFPAPPMEHFAEIKKDSLTLDMESAAAYQVGKLFNVPTLVIRGVSNSIDETGKDAAVADSDISSSDRAAKLVLDCIEAMTVQSSSSTATI